MRRFLAPVLVALLTVSLSGASACNKSVKPSELNQIIAFGDSLVFGVGTTTGNNFVSLLSQRVSETIINAGRPGDTTGTALSRLKAAVLDLNPRIVIVLLGGNDLLQNVPLQQRITNITSIATQIRGTGAEVILVGLSEGNVIDPYDGALPGIASQTSSALVPGILDGIFGDPALMADSIHPNNAGHKIMADRIEPALRAAMALQWQLEMGIVRPFSFMRARCARTLSRDEGLTLSHGRGRAGTPARYRRRLAT